jgi:uncharacterized membrane protein HdeD (DUF308 family)
VSSSAYSPGVGGPAVGGSGTDAVAQEVSRLWWLWLVTGVAWIVAALIILQFDDASITTVGIIVGCMFMFAAVQQLLLALTVERLRWLWAIFGALFFVSGIVCFVNPEATFAGFADILGFLFLTAGVWWTIAAFIERDVNPLWWLTLVAGILLIVMAFWTSGQFFIEKAYTLLVFAGIWALMHGITDIMRAFVVRSERDTA